MNIRSKFLRYKESSLHHISLLHDWESPCQGDPCRVTPSNPTCESPAPGFPKSLPFHDATPPQLGLQHPTLGSTTMSCGCFIITWFLLINTCSKANVKKIMKIIKIIKDTYNPQIQRKPLLTFDIFPHCLCKILLHTPS